MQAQVTQIIQQWHQGDRLARESLYQFAYTQLHQLAKHERRKISTKHQDDNLIEHEEVFNTTSLIHEAYIKLEQLDKSYIQNRRQFYAMICKIMRQVMFESARKNNAKKRHLPTDVEPSKPAHNDDFNIDIIESLNRFNDKYPRQAEVLNLKYFMGFDNETISQVLQSSQSLVEKDAKFAKSWLTCNLPN